MDRSAGLAELFGAVLPYLDERQRRLLLGAEARRFGHGGIKAVALAAGVSVDTVSAGVAEVASGAGPDGRVRRPGGGRPRADVLDPGLVPALLALVEPDVRGDPMSPLRWTTKSTRNLAAELSRAGHRVSAPVVGTLLRAQGFSLQGNAKVVEGVQHPDRDAQFRYLNAQVKEHQGAGEPVVSVDAKKKEVVGEFKNAGREWRPAGDPRRVEVHDFPDEVLGKVLPYGVYDVAANTGWVNVGTDHDTAAFAIESIRRWWNAVGRLGYPAATRLLITADAGGSNGYRTRAWKTGLAALAAETGLAITVCHMPPGTSKWNKIEHRLFSAITMNWRGRPLTSHEVIVNSIAATTTSSGLKVHAELDPGSYPTGVEIGEDQMDAVAVIGHGFHGEWNYTVYPADGPDTPMTAAGVDRDVLAEPALTGISRTELDALATALAAPAAAAREAAARQRLGDARRRAPGGGRRPALGLPDQVLAVLLHRRLGIPVALLARLLAVGKDPVRKAITTTGQLLDQHGFATPPPAAHLTTLAGFTRYADSTGTHIH
jgi:hypothetical protein